MKNMPSTKAKDNFGELLDTAQKQPVQITKKDRPVAVVLSLEEYQRLQDIEDSWWASRAKSASKAGYIGNKKSEDLLNELLDVED